MISKLKSISLTQWMMISMVLGLIVGLALNLCVEDSFVKNTILMDNIFYIGGNGFIKLIKMMIIPLVFCSIVVGVSSISDVKTLGKIGGNTILLYLITTAIAIIIALAISNMLQPGLGLNFAGAEYGNKATMNQTFADTMLNIIPENLIESMADGEMVPIIIFATLVGIFLTKFKEETKTVNNFFKEANKLVMEITGFIMKFAPIGIFCLMAKTFGSLGFDVLIPLLSFIGCVILCLAIQMFIIYPIILISITGLDPRIFYRRFFPVMLFAFNTCSSNATIPINLEKLYELGVSSEVSSFSIPLGATINMDGTSIFQVCAVMFTAQAFGIHFGPQMMLLIIITIMLMSIGTPGIPSAGVVTLNTVMLSVGLPLSTIGLFLGIDHIVNMFRIVSNVVGDAICTICVSFKNGYMDTDVYNGKKSPYFEEYKN